MQKNRPEERFFLVVSSECRVRQLVAMVHTALLNGRAPNASALKSKYRIASILIYI